MRRPPQDQPREFAHGRVPTAFQSTIRLIPPIDDKKISDSDTAPLPAPYTRSIMDSSREIGHPVLPRGDTGRTRPTPSDSKSHTRLRQDQRPVALAGVVATGPAPPHTLGGQRIHLSHIFRERPGPGNPPDPCAVRQTLSGQKPMRNPSAVGLTTTTITSGRRPNPTIRRYRDHHRKERNISLRDPP